MTNFIVYIRFEKTHRDLDFDLNSIRLTEDRFMALLSRCGSYFEFCHSWNFKGVPAHFISIALFDSYGIGRTNNKFYVFPNELITKGYFIAGFLANFRLTANPKNCTIFSSYRG